ncbi:hypothetical protein [Fluviicola sp.]|uniref:hypothetical protein n=1 Tax=Fluviicola sp. TaxID=1917219 RepID=UPI0031E03A81
MKKLIFAFALLGMALVSCKKDYSCTCTETGTNYYDSDFDGVDEAHPYSNTSNYKIEGATKTDAIAACNEAKITSQDGLDTYEYKCDLSK